MKFTLLALLLAFPALAQAGETRQTISWKKPRFVISVREPCLDRAIKKDLVLLEAKMISETATTMQVECTFLK